MEMWKALTEFTKELFGVDVVSSDLPEGVQHANRVQFLGVPVSLVEATRTAIFDIASVIQGVTNGIADVSDSIPRWRTLVATDFSAQPDQTFSADGTYVIDGHVWTVKNSANKVTNSPFRIVNGTGLQLPASSITGVATFYTSSRTNPRILLPLYIFSQIKNSTPVRAMFELAYLRSNTSAYRTLVGIVFENNTDNTRSNSVAHLGGLAAPGSTPTNLYVLSSFTRSRTHVSTSVVINTGVIFLGDSNQLGITMPNGLPGSKPAAWGCSTAAHDAFEDMERLAITTYDGTTIDPNTVAWWEEMQAPRWWVSLVSGVEGTAGNIERYPVIKKFKLEAYY